MATRYTSCIFCKHREEGNNFTCAAFPNGIPNAIIFGENKHFKPFPGDHGIQFEPLPQFKEQFREEVQSRQSPGSSRTRVSQRRNG